LTHPACNNECKFLIIFTAYVTISISTFRELGLMYICSTSFLDANFTPADTSEHKTMKDK